MPEFNPSSQRARTVLHDAIAAGVRHVVLSPGSRSQALALEAARLETEGVIELHVRTDERTAGFVALGIGRATGVPAAVITTSGSAVANLLPAVLEAHHAGVPMLLLTADRPAKLRGIRSNQTTRQDLMLAPFVRDLVDVAPLDGESSTAAELSTQRAVWVAQGSAPGADGQLGAGAVQLNLQFEMPLSGLAPEHPITVESAPTVRPVEPLSLPVGPRTLVIAGAGAGAEAEAFARAAEAPLIAEIVSGAHFGPQLVVAYRDLLTVPEFADSVERVVVFGTPTLSREIPALLSRPNVEVWVMKSAGADDYHPTGHKVNYSYAVTPVGEVDDELREWCQVWVSASRKLRADADREREISTESSGVAYGGHVEDFAAQRDYVTNELAAIRAPLDRQGLVEAVWQATWPHDRVLFGASRLVRVADATLPGKTAHVFANRGQSGIDGTIATGIGLALAAEGGMTRVVLGDLAALHDSGSLKLTPGERLPAIQVIVGNDRGGTIFDQLEVAHTADRDDFDRVQLTPHEVNFAALAEAYGWEYRLADNVGALDQALTGASDRPVLIEVPLER